jgi:predicted nucleic acid-binding protein
LKKKLYIETSVWNQLEHTDRQDWRETAEKFIEVIGMGFYEPYISIVVINEILATTDVERQKKLLAHINKVQPIMLDLDNEATSLSRQYVEMEFKGSASQRIFRDCCHVAIATVNNIKLLNDEGKGMPLQDVRNRLSREGSKNNLVALWGQEP